MELELSPLFHITSPILVVEVVLLVAAGVLVVRRTQRGYVGTLSLVLALVLGTVAIRTESPVGTMLLLTVQFVTLLSGGWALLRDLKTK